MIEINRTRPPLISSNSFNSFSEQEWPQSPGPDAFSGLAGEVVAAIDPHTEADPVAVLAGFLIAFGNAVGPGAHFLVGATRHHAREFFGCAGKSSKARKGDSWSPIRTLMSQVDTDWAGNIGSGLSSGEGLLHAVRDPLERTEPIKEKGKITGYQKVLIDDGVEDKRLLVVEPELARVLAVITRQGNTLSPVVRDLWDTGNGRVMTRADPIRATGAHVSILGHITTEELCRELTEVSAANGFANRFVWLAVRRSKLLPEPEPFTGEPLARLTQWVGSAYQQAQRVGTMQRDKAAGELWRSVYPDLSEEREGLAGSLLARAEAHVLRLSMLYALLDGSALIRMEHLTAALELWGYSERSVAYIFADVLGDPMADAILRALRATDYMTRTDIANLFGRNESAARLSTALQSLHAKGLAHMETEETAGRPREIWRSVP